MVGLWLDVSRYGITVEESELNTDGNDLYVGPIGGGTWQKNVYVDANGTYHPWGGGYRWTDAWTSINDAIRALRIQDSTIHVRPGVYGSFWLNDIPCFQPDGEKHLIIESTGGATVTFIDGSGYGIDDNGVVTSGVWCASCGNETVSPHVTLRGFTLCNGLGAARGVEHLENCRIENCYYGLSNTFTTACTLSNVHAPFAPGSGVSAAISNSPLGFRVSPRTQISGSQSQMLFGSPSLSSRVWSTTTDFDDSAFMQTNRFFMIGVRRETSSQD